MQDKRSEDEESGEEDASSDSGKESVKTTDPDEVTSSIAGEDPAKKSEPGADSPKKSLPKTQQDRIKQAIEDTQLLIGQAATAGKEVPKDLIEVIAKTQREFENDEFGASEEADFWISVAKVTQHVSPITIESINYTLTEKRKRDKKPKENNLIAFLGRLTNIQHVTPYLAFTLFTLAALIYVQIDWVGGNNLVRSIDELTKSEAILEKEIQLSNIIISVARSEEDEKSRREVEVERDGKRKLLNQKQNELNASRLLLNEWVSSYVSDPERPVRPSLFATDEQKAKWELEMEDWWSAYEQKQASQSDLTFQQAQSILQNMAGYFLPLLYGLLGAFTYVLRALSREISGISFSRGSHIQFLLRLLLGLLAGVSVGWFLRTDSSETALLDISPFALAFLAGYSVELVFTAMDKIVNTFSSTGSPSKPV